MGGIHTTLIGWVGGWRLFGALFMKNDDVTVEIVVLSKVCFENMFAHTPQQLMWRLMRAQKWR